MFLSEIKKMQGLLIMSYHMLSLLDRRHLHIRYRCLFGGCCCIDKRCNERLNI